MYTIKMKYLKYFFILVGLTIFFILFFGFILGFWTGINTSVNTQNEELALKAGVLNIGIEIENVYSEKNGYSDFLKDENLIKAKRIQAEVEKEISAKTNGVIKIKDFEYVIKLKSISSNNYYCLDTVTATITKKSFTTEDNFNNQTNCN